MTRTLTMGMLALLIVSSAQAAQLLEDQMDYADAAAMRTVWKSDFARTIDTTWSYNPNGLSFANHFASAGGSVQAASNQMAYAELDSSVQITGPWADSTGFWNGKSFTFYLSYLINADQIRSWMGGTAGAAIRMTGSEATGGWGAGFGQTYPDSDDFVSNIAAGTWVDARWNLSRERTYSGGTIMAEDTTYLVLAKYVYTNAAGSPYNPYQGGSLAASLLVLTEADPYPTDEASITWDYVSMETSNYPGGLELSAFMASLAGGANDTSGNGMRIDELRIGTEYADVMVPEPATIALLGMGVLASLRRRRR